MHIYIEVFVVMGVYPKIIQSLDHDFVLKPPL